MTTTVGELVRLLQKLNPQEQIEIIHPNDVVGGDPVLRVTLERPRAITSSDLMPGKYDEIVNGAKTPDTPCGNSR
jgi:hypothetical protein